MKAVHYHDTLPESPQNAAEYEYKATKQNKLVFAFFKTHPYKEFTPLMVWDALIKSGDILRSVPYTSIRRSCTNLEKANWLEHGMMRMMERFGRVNGTWVYRPRIKQLKLF